MAPAIPARDLAGVTVAFDLDGTLVDTAPDLHRALEAVMAQEGLATPPFAATRLMVGQGARTMIARAAAAHGLSWSQTRLDQLTETFVMHYAADIARDSRPFPNVEHALEQLAGAGAVLCVCTNKRTGLSERLLEAVNLRRHFAAVVGADAVAARKPDPGHFLAAIAAAGGQRDRALMVGDSAADVLAAQSAGAPVVAVRFGYCEEGVETLGAEALIGDFAELPAVVRQFLG